MHRYAEEKEGEAANIHSSSDLFFFFHARSCFAIKAWKSRRDVSRYQGGKMYIIDTRELLLHVKREFSV